MVTKRSVLKIIPFLSIPVSILAIGCISLFAKAQGLPSAKNKHLLTHLKVPGPPRLTPENEVLWIGIESYLGKSEGSKKVSDLKLTSSSGLVRIQDANGLIHKAAEITITWRKVPVKESIKIARFIKGPFASFESAQKVAFELRKSGYNPHIANPSMWEVWLPSNTQLTQDLNFSLWKESITDVIQPFLKGATTNHMLVGPIEIQSEEGLKIHGGSYKGPFLLQANAYGSWTLVEQVPIKRYLAGVLPHEIGSNSPKEALKAQSVLARTWAIANSHRFVIDGYHLCANTQCQVYKHPNKASNEVKKAIANTKDIVLSWQKEPINAVYHATNGGIMAAASEAWAIENVPYLKPTIDGSRQWTKEFKLPIKKSSDLRTFLKLSNGAHGQNHPRFRWSKKLTAQDIEKSLLIEQKSFKRPFQIKVLERGTSGRVISLEIRGSGQNQNLVLRHDKIRKSLPQLASTLFVVDQISKEEWLFSGGGFGHGVGLSQAGAIDLAKKGWNHKQILRHYYPGTSYGPLHDLLKDP